MIFAFFFIESQNRVCLCNVSTSAEVCIFSVKMATLQLLLDDVERGGKESDGSIEDDFAYRNNVANAAQHIRMGFIRKVYGLLSMQLLLTIVVAGMCMMTPKIKEFIHSKYVYKG